LNDDTVLTLLSFGAWVSLLCFSLCVAGWIGDKVRDRWRPGKGEYDDLVDAIKSESGSAARGVTVAEVVAVATRADREAALRSQNPDKAA
jgi:hypothetical protein